MLYIILILLFTARIFSEVARRFNIPALVGEILAGILIGFVFREYADTFPAVKNLHENEVFYHITELGMFFIMLYAGIELSFKSLKATSTNAIWIALGGMILPLALGLGLGWWMFPESELKSAQTLFLGVALAITAVPVAIKVLMDLNALNSKPGQTIVSAAIIDDILSLVLLAAMTSLIETGSLPNAKDWLILTGKVLLFFAITIAIGLLILPKLENLVAKKINIDESEVSFLLVVALGFSVLADALGMHFIIGAFAAGLFFTQRKLKGSVYEDVRSKIKAITYGFFAPIFFASIGLSLDLTALVHVPFFVILLIIVAMAAKVLGAGIPARLLGMDKKEAFLIGNAMNARGAVELIIADIALRAGLFESPANSEIIQNLFSAIVIMAVVTTLVTPFILRAIVKTSAKNFGIKSKRKDD